MEKTLRCCISRKMVVVSKVFWYLEECLFIHSPWKNMLWMFVYTFSLREISRYECLFIHSPRNGKKFKFRMFVYTFTQKRYQRVPRSCCRIRSLNFIDFAAYHNRLHKWCNYMKSPFVFVLFGGEYFSRRQLGNRCTLKCSYVSYRWMKCQKSS